MYKYKVIEEVLYEKLHTKDLVEFIFKKLYTIQNKHRIKLIKEVKKELNYFMIETIYLDDVETNDKLTRCSICNKIIKTKERKLNFYNYMDCVDHLDRDHSIKETYHNTIFNYLQNV